MRWGNPGDGDSPLCLPPWRDAARLQGSLEEELGQLRKRSFPEALRVPGEEPRFRRPPRARSPGSGRLLEGPARARGSVRVWAQPRGGSGASQVCGRHRTPQAGAATCGKAFAPRLSKGAEPRPLAPPLGSPFLAQEMRRCKAPVGGHLLPAPPPSLSPQDRASSRLGVSGASHSPHGPRSEGARLRRRQPGSAGDEIAWRLQGWR